MKPETVVEIVKKSFEKHKDSEHLGRWRRMADDVLKELAKMFASPYVCPFCGQKYKKWNWFKEHLERHLFKIIYHFDEKRGQWSPLLGYCVDCGKFVISPSSSINMGSIRNLKRNGYTGDFSGSGYCEYHRRFEEGGLYCIECMKKAGWQWGEREKDEYD